MVISDVSIQRPVLAFVVSAMLLVLGVLGYQRLPIREIPRIDAPVVSVNTDYPGASAEVVDNEITEKIERTINSVEGIRIIRSRSSEGKSQVNIEFEISRDIDAAANDVRDRVGRVLSTLPDTVKPPQIEKSDSDNQPILFASMTSDRMNQMELTDYARRNLVDPLSTVPGVASVRIMGSREFAIRIWLDRAAMAARGVTVPDIEQAVIRENAELPAGRIESAEREFTVRTATRLNTPAQFGRIVLKQDRDSTVRLSEVAHIEVGPRDDRSEGRLDGRPNVMLGVQRQSTANTVEVAREVRAIFEELQGSLPEGLSLTIRHDESVFISRSIEEVLSAIGIAVLLVMVVIWVFLRTLRATLIPVVAIPVSLVSAMAVLALAGFSINVLTLLAFVLAVGLVVDDAIIVVENASRRIEGGEPPLLAAYRGARQIGFAVIATTLVLIAVILPLAGLDGTQGRLFREFAVALVASIIFSCLVALTLSPMLCSKLLRDRGPHGTLFQASDRVFQAVADFYARLLDRAMAAPGLMLALLAGAFTAAGVLFVSLPAELAPTEDRGFVRIRLNAPEGATMDYTRREFEQVEEILRPYLARHEVAVIIGGINNGGGANGVNQAAMNIRFTPWEERDRSVPQVVAEINPKLAAMPGSRVSAQLPSGLTTGGGAAGGSNQMQFVLGGSTFEELGIWRDAVMERLAQDKILTALQANYDETKPQLRIEVDRERAANLGIGIADIGATLETMMGGRQVTRYLDRGEEYDVMLQAAERDRATPRDLSNIYIRGAKSAQLIPLHNLIQVVDTAGPTELNRYNRQRSVTITGNLNGITMGQAIDRVRQVVRDTLPTEARLSFEGAARQQIEASQSFLFAFGMALVVAFLVLSAQFENFRLPAIILLAAPLAVFGGVLTITLIGMTVNVYTEIGLIMLIGMVAKNAILIVEFANQLRDEGRDLAAAVREAARIRFRPILMTSIATVFGALPLALASGAGAEARRAIGWVIVGGIIIGTGLSLLVTPVLYRMFARDLQPIGAIRRRIQRLDAEHGPLEAPAE